MLPLLLVRFARLIIAFTVSGSAWAQAVHDEDHDEDSPCMTFWLQASTTFLKAFNSSSVIPSILATRSSHSLCYIDMCACALLAATEQSLFSRRFDSRSANLDAAPMYPAKKPQSPLGP